MAEKESSAEAEKRQGSGEESDSSSGDENQPEKEVVTGKSAAQSTREERLKEVVTEKSAAQSTREERLKEVGTGKSAAQSTREERLKRLRELHLKRNEARKLNHVEVVEEDRRNKLPANWEARKRKIDWEIADEEARKEAEAAGEDYDRIKLLETSATDLERLERKKKKKNPDTGFADYAQAQYRQYQRITKDMPQPDMEAYEKQRQEMGEDFYPGVNTLGYGGKGKVSQAGIDRMVEDLEKQIEKRAKFSRRKAFDHDADVDYINERNMKFNKKAARFYDQYTSEVKQNLERGTAI